MPRRSTFATSTPLPRFRLSHDGRDQRRPAFAIAKSSIAFFLLPCAACICHTRQTLFATNDHSFAFCATHPFQPLVNTGYSPRCRHIRLTHPLIMQALSTHLPWISDFIHDRSQDRMACAKPRHVPVVEIPFYNKLKRKRTEASDTSHDAPIRDGPRHTAHALALAATPPPPTTVAPKHDAPQRASVATSRKHSSSILSPYLNQETKDRIDKMASDPERRTKLQQRIDAEFNHQILLKHEELRCIDQELAKCQIALEQLRRCKAIPYPSEPGSQVTFEQMSTGTGPALRPRAGTSLPPNPPAWAVTDGPYTRHYARWLIPDAQFDSTFMDMPRRTSSAKVPGGLDARTTRGTFAVERASFSASRAQRASVGSKLQSLSSSPYPPPKDRHGPLIIKRSSDGQLVKLICRFCQKDNISSVQGFLNHCRIAHDKNYESHNAAAIDCGVPLDGTENACLGAAPELPTPTLKVNDRPLVHPLITRNRPTPQTSLVGAAPSAPAGALSVRPPRQAAHSEPIHSPLPKLTPKTPLLSSQQTPRLATLLEKRGFGGDLASLVSFVTTKCNIDEVESLEASGDEDDEEGRATHANGSMTSMHSHWTATSTSTGPVGGMRVPAQASAQPAGATLIAGSQPQHRDTLAANNKPRPLHLTQSRAQLVEDSFTSHSPSIAVAASPPTLSPHTVDTNPGLEEDNGSDASQHSEDEEEPGTNDRSMARRPSVWVNGDNDEIMRDVREDETKTIAGPATVRATPASSAGRGRAYRGRITRRGGGGGGGGGRGGRSRVKNSVV